MGFSGLGLRSLRFRVFGFCSFFCFFSTAQPAPDHWASLNFGLNYEHCHRHKVLRFQHLVLRFAHVLLGIIDVVELAFDHHGTSSNDDGSHVDRDELHIGA